MPTLLDKFPDEFDTDSDGKFKKITNSSVTCECCKKTYSYGYYNISDQKFKCLDCILSLDQKK